jgi:hypothetical protein
LWKNRGKNEKKYWIFDSEKGNIILAKIISGKKMKKNVLFEIKKKKKKIFFLPKHQREGKPLMKNLELN